MSVKPSEPKSYSPFWPILIVFLTLAVVQAVYLRNTLAARNQMNARRAEMQKVLPQAQLINSAVENLGKELLELSDRNTNEAAKIISEFNIQMTGAPAAATSAPPVAPVSPVSPVTPLSPQAPVAPVAPPAPSAAVPPTDPK